MLYLGSVCYWILHCIYDKMSFERTDMEAMRNTLGDAKNIMYGSYTYETFSA